MSPKDEGKKSDNRVPLMMSDKELEAFDKARAEVYPLACAPQKFSRGKESPI